MSPAPVIAIIGGGPRGVLLLDRIAANIAELGPAEVEIIVVDDTQVGAGRVWRTDQTRELCMNTLADAVTLFTDASVTMDGPVREGPTMYEWGQLALAQALPRDATAASEIHDRVAAIPREHARVFAAQPVRASLVDDYRDELETQRPESHPSRALYGEYIRWCWERAVAAAPPGVRVREGIGRVVSATERDGRQVLALADRSEIVADTVVAATGWLRPAPSPFERAAADAAAANPDLVVVAQGSPVEQNLDDVPDGADAIVRGVGMGFFDAMALLSIGRGGRFVDDPDAAPGLRYEPSGREPRLFVTSRRGVPYRAKSLFGALPPKADLSHARSVDWSAEPRPVDFETALWPLLVKDAFAAYYRTLARERPGAVDLERVLAAIAAPSAAELAAAPTDRVPDDAAETAQYTDDDALAHDALPAERLATAVAPFVPDPADRLDLASLIAPGWRHAFAGPDDYDAWVAAFVARDLVEAERGAASAEKAAVWVIGAGRKLASTIGTFGGFDAESRDGGQARFTAAGNHAGSGPPAFRNRQLLALHDAGLVRFVGPARVTADASGFRAASDVSGAEVEAMVLIDALMRQHDVRESDDELIASLRAAGRLRPFEISTRVGGREQTGGIDVDQGSGLLVHADGAVDRAFHVCGIPLDQTMHDALISPMPGSDATMLRETDRVARSLLRVAARARAAD